MKEVNNHSYFVTYAISPFLAVSPEVDGCATTAPKTRLDAKTPFWQTKCVFGVFTLLFLQPTGLNKIVNPTALGPASLGLMDL